MSILTEDSAPKWVNALLAIIGVLVVFVTIRFIGQMGEWFDLEAQIPYFVGISQGIGVVTGLATFLALKMNKSAMLYLDEVFGELLKVVWPDKDSVFKTTIGLVIGITIVSGLFILVDFLFRKVLELLY